MLWTTLERDGVSEIQQSLGRMAYQKGRGSMRIGTTTYFTPIITFFKLYSGLAFHQTGDAQQVPTRLEHGGVHQKHNLLGTHVTLQY